MSNFKDLVKVYGEIQKEVCDKKAGEVSAYTTLKLLRNAPEILETIVLDKKKIIKYLDDIKTSKRGSPLEFLLSVLGIKVKKKVIAGRQNYDYEEENFEEITQFLNINKEAAHEYCEKEFDRVQEYVKQSAEALQQMEKEKDNLSQELYKANRTNQSIKELLTLEEGINTRAYQMILSKIGLSPADETVRWIKKEIEDSIEEQNIKLIWELPRSGVEKMFVSQIDFKDTKNTVVRPCIMKGDRVIHKGVYLALRGDEISE